MSRDMPKRGVQVRARIPPLAPMPRYGQEQQAALAKRGQRTQTDAPGLGKQPDRIPRDIPRQQAQQRSPALLAHPPVKIFST